MMKLYAMAVHGYVLQTKQSKNQQTILLIGLNMSLREKRVSRATKETKAIRVIQVQPGQKATKVIQDRPDRKVFPAHHSIFT